ncbi:MAG: hypothetical protein J6A58_05255 [Oscillospiraceae bacterium]|nr:hypothetical protein [Oscillospiraceae bacterium]
MLKGTIKPVDKFSQEEIASMYSLMAQFYDNTDEDVFRRDFYDKDYCLVLQDENAVIVGFTTQKVIAVDVEGRTVHGVFSGDTIIHKDHWGETELFRVWARFWFDYAEKYDEFYWFLICKGYKTYRILPVFWEHFYPDYRRETPSYEKKIIDAYASALYPDEYNPESGVIEYKSQKDRLKSGVSDIGEHEMKNKDIAFFCNANPGHTVGNDIACLARINRTYMKKRTERLLFG